ncbi:hypothetical protein PYCC9005_004687 [Savitreella phatthalungensis]
MGLTVDDLPAEVLINTFSHIPEDLGRGCLVSKHFHRSLTPYLYSSPQLRDTDAYLAFAETILSRRSLGKHVRFMNLERVIGTLKTVRLPEVMRCCRRMREFTAAQASFTSYMISALGEWEDLRVLDLCYVCERFEMSKVVNACSSLPKLHTLRWPRCQVSGVYPIRKYPPVLRSLSVRGGVRDDALRKMASPTAPAPTPETLEHVSVSYSPTLGAPAVLTWLASMPQTLTKVEVTWPLIRFGHNALDALLLVLPQVTHVRVSVDYLSARFLENAHTKLERLDLLFSGVGMHRGFTFDDLHEAIEAVDVPEVDDAAESLEATIQVPGTLRFPRLSIIATSPRLDDLLFGKPRLSTKLRALKASGFGTPSDGPVTSVRMDDGREVAIPLEGLERPRLPPLQDKIKGQRQSDSASEAFVDDVEDDFGVDADAERRIMQDVCDGRGISWWIVPDSYVPDDAQWHF